MTYPMKLDNAVKNRIAEINDLELNDPSSKIGQLEVGDFVVNDVYQIGSVKRKLKNYIEVLFINNVVKVNLDGSPRGGVSGGYGCHGYTPLTENNLPTVVARVKSIATKKLATFISDYTTNVKMNNDTREYDTLLQMAKLVPEDYQ